MAVYINDQFVVLFGTIEIPLYGNWWAKLDVEIGTVPKVGTQVKITILDQFLMGRLIGGGNYHNRSSMYIEGGLGDITQKLPSKYYQQMTVGLIAQDIATACKLTVQNAAVSSQRLATWTRLATTGGSQLKRLLNRFGWFYRIKDDGSIGLFNDKIVNTVAQYKIDLDYQEMDYDTVEQKYTIAPFTKMITHEKSFLPKDASRITHNIDKNQIRTFVWVKQ